MAGTRGAILQGKTTITLPDLTQRRRNLWSKMYYSRDHAFVGVVDASSRASVARVVCTVPVEEATAVKVHHTATVVQSSATPLNKVISKPVSGAWLATLCMYLEVYTSRIYTYK